MKISLLRKKWHMCTLKTNKIYGEPSISEFWLEFWGYIGFLNIMLSQHNVQKTDIPPKLKFKIHHFSWLDWMIYCAIGCHITTLLRVTGTINMSFSTLCVNSDYLSNGTTVSCACWSGDGSRLIVAIGCILHVSTDAFTYFCFIFIFSCVFQHLMDMSGLPDSAPISLFGR